MATHHSGARIATCAWAGASTNPESMHRIHGSIHSARASPGPPTPARPGALTGRADSTLTLLVPVAAALAEVGGDLGMRLGLGGRLWGYVLGAVLLSATVSSRTSPPSPSDAPSASILPSSSR